MTPRILSGIVGREFKRVLRNRARLASTFARTLFVIRSRKADASPLAEITS